MDGPLRKPLTAANAEKILVGLFTTEPARDVRDTDYYRDQTADGDDPLDPALKEPHGNKEKTANRPRDPGVIPSRDLKYPNGSLLLSPRAIIARTLMQRLQELSELPRGVHRMWGYI